MEQSITPEEFCCYRFTAWLSGLLELSPSPSSSPLRSPSPLTSPHFSQSFSFFSPASSTCVCNPLFPATHIPPKHRGCLGKMPAEKHLLATRDQAKGLEGHCGQTRWDPESVSVLCGVPRLPMTGEGDWENLHKHMLPSLSGLHGTSSGAAPRSAVRGERPFGLAGFLEGRKEIS